MRVIILDHTGAVTRRTQRLLATAGFDTLTVDSLESLARPLASADPGDALLVHMPSDRSDWNLADCLRQARFPGRTYLLGHSSGQIGFARQPQWPRVESVEYENGHGDPPLDRLLLRLLASAPPSPRTQASEPPPFQGLVGRSRQIQEIFTRIQKVAAGDVNVCVYGESGTGKELIARAIHAMSDRRDRPLVTFDCTAVPEGLVESQLFGHVRGAFTGAVENRDGVFSLADTGTLFLDELCELGLSLQAKLLRVIQTREFVKVGGTKPIHTDIRLITATNTDPKKAADAGTFRADLYYRVAVVMIRVPPLRERPEDIPLLVEHFLRRYSIAYKKPIRGVQPATIERLQALPWPGNVRQLENLLAQAVVLAEGDVLTERDLFADDVSAAAASIGELHIEPGLPLREVERRYIVRTLQNVDGNRTEAARQLGISLRCLQYKLKAYARTGDLCAISPAPADCTVHGIPPSKSRTLASLPNLRRLRGHGRSFGTAGTPGWQGASPPVS